MKIPAQQYTVLQGVDLIRDVAYEANRAKHLIWAQAMEYEPGEITDRLTAIFSNAAKRGRDAKLNIDYYSLYVTDGIFNYLPLFNRESTIERKRRLIRKIQAIHTLRDTNVDIQVLNKPNALEKLFPSKGRNHIKFIIVDNTAWLGGINFRDRNFLIHDFMVKMSDPHVVNFLKQLFMHMHDREQLFDMSAKLSKDIKLFLDGGKSGSSVIMDEVIIQIQSARERIDLTSPFYPNGKVLNALHKAHLNGIHVRVICPPIGRVEGMAKVVNAIDRTIMNIENKKIPLRVVDEGMHAKLCILDNKIAIFGSHNFTSRGVTMGTTEIAIETTNPKLIENLQNYFDSLLTP